MSVLHQFLYVLYHFIALFMRFPELTYWQDAAVPVPVFFCSWFPQLPRKGLQDGVEVDAVASDGHDGALGGIYLEPCSFAELVK